MKDVISHIPNVQVSWFTALFPVPCLVMLEPLRSNTGAQLLIDPQNT